MNAAPALPNRSLEWIAVLAVFALAYVLRLGYTGVNAFASDEARLSVMALEMARSGNLAEVGIASSASLRNLPASVYVFVPPYIVNPDPLFATQYMGWISWGAVVLLWWTVRRTWGAWTAWGTAFIFAVMPFNVFFSRNIWAQNWLAPLTVVWLFAMSWAASGRHGRLMAVMLGTIVAGITFQIHLAGVGLGLAHVVATLRFGRPSWLLPLVVGSIIGLLPLVPFVNHALCCAPEVRAEYEGVLNGVRNDRTVWSDVALRYNLQLALNQDWDYLATGEEALAQALQDTASIGIVLLYVLGASVFFRIIILLNRSRSALAELGLYVTLSTLFLFSVDRASAPTRLHYLLASLPALALLAGASLAALRPNGGRVFVLVIMIAVGGMWAYQVNSSLRLLDKQLVANGLGMPLKAMRDLAIALPEGHEVVMHTQSDDIQTRGEPATWRVLLWERPHRIIDGWTTLLLPSTTVLLMTDVNGMPAWEEAEFAGIARDVVTLQTMENSPPATYTLYEGGVPTGYLPIEPPVRFSNGLELVAWQQRVISGRLRISTVYRVLDVIGGLDTPRQFTHLRTTRTLEGAPLGGADIPLAYGAWRVGDTVIGIADFLEFERSVSYWVDIGHYSLGTGERFQREDGRGDSVRIGAFTLSP